MLADLPNGSPVQHLIITGGKDGSLYVLDRDALGGYGDGHAWQEISIAAEGPLASGPPGVLWGSAPSGTTPTISRAPSSR